MLFRSQHEEKTDLSKLKKGGRSKKAVGTVKKYCGGKSVKKMAGGGDTSDEGIDSAESTFSNSGARISAADTKAASDAKKPQSSGYDTDPFVKLRKKIFGS